VVEIIKSKADYWKILFNRVVNKEPGTEAEDVGVGSRYSFVMMGMIPLL